MKELIKSNWKYYMFIIMVGIMITSPLLIKGLPVAHDAIYPVTRSLGTAVSLSEGQMPPLVTSNFANGFRIFMESILSTFKYICDVTFKGSNF